MAKEIVMLKDPLSQAILKEAMAREKRVLELSIAQVKHRIGTFEKKYGNLDRQKLYGMVDDLELAEWEGEVETLKRLLERLQHLEDIQV